MWTISFIILTLQLCGELSGHSIYRGFNHDDTNEQVLVPVNQHQEYTKEYGRALHDLASYRQKLEHQGLFPPFILTNNANDLGYQYLPQYQQHQQQQQQHNTEEKGINKHKFIPSINFHNEDQQRIVSEKKVSNHSPFKKSTKIATKKVKPVVESQQLNANLTIETLGQKIDKKINAIKSFYENSVREINKLNDGIRQQVINKKSRIFKAIIMKLEKMEKQLHDLNDDESRNIGEIHETEETKEEKLINFETDSDEDEEEDEYEDLGRSLFPSPNVVDSEAGKKLKQLDEIDAEMRSDFKHSIVDAIKRAQDKFNQLIEDQINRVNNKFSKINEKLEAMMAKLKHHPADVTEEYTTIHWEPETTTTTTTPAPKPSTTPDYYKYTVPSNFFHKYHNIDIRNEKNNFDSWKIIDDENELEASAETQIVDENIPITHETKDELEQQQVNDVVKAVKEELLSELQTNSDSGKLLKNSIESDDDDKIKKSTETELRRKYFNQPEIIEGGEENDSEDNDDGDEEEEEEMPAEIDENVESSGNDEEMPSIDDDEEKEIATTEIPVTDEDVASEIDKNVVRPIDASKTFPFDELEVIQLIPIIIEQLRQNHVTEDEKKSLEKIFGDSLWSLIIAEALRIKDAEEMNPLLRTILSSEEVRLAKRDIQAQIGNDIYKNSLRRVYRGKVPSHGLKSKRKSPYISFDDDRKLLSPSERLLNMIAAIVHKSNVMEKEKADAEARLREKRKYARKNANKKKFEKKIPLGIVVPRQRYVDRILSTNRMKRSIIKFGTDLADMKALLDQANNQKNDSNEESKLSSEIEDDLDDYMNDDYYMDDEEEDDGEDEEIGWFSNRKTRSFYDDYEDGSVNEFINLARQRDRREKNSQLPQLQEDTNEYDDEEEGEVYDYEN